MLGPELPVARHALIEEPSSPPSALRDTIAPKIAPGPPSARRLALAGFLLGYVGLALAAACAWLLPGAADAPNRPVLLAAVVMMAIGFTLALVVTMSRTAPRAT